jgi:hypothetical protein
MSADEGGIVDVFTILRDAGFNLQMAGGANLDTRGELVFAVYHDDGDDRPNHEAKRVLTKHGYRSRVVPAHHCDVANEPGGLLGCLERIQSEDGPIAEIYVGVGDQHNVPIQLVTRRGLESGEYGEESAG